MEVQLKVALPSNRAHGASPPPHLRRRSGMVQRASLSTVQKRSIYGPFYAFDTFCKNYILCNIVLYAHQNSKLNMAPKYVFFLKLLKTPQSSYIKDSSIKSILYHLSKLSSILPKYQHYTRMVLVGFEPKKACDERNGPKVYLEPKWLRYQNSYIIMHCMFNNILYPVKRG